MQAQTYPRIVHFVLATTSTDARPDIIARFKGRRVPVVVVQNDATLLLIESWNAALRLVPRMASYFRVLSADDLIVADGIEKTVAVGERQSDVGIIGCQEWVDGEVLGAELPPDRSVFDGRGIVRGSMRHTLRGFPHSHCLYRMPRDGMPERFYGLEYDGVPLLPLDVDAGMRTLSGGGAMAMCTSHW